MSQNTENDNIFYSYFTLLLKPQLSQIERTTTSIKAFDFVHIAKFATSPIFSREISNEENSSGKTR